MSGHAPLDVASLSHPGMVRTHNEDSVFVDGESGLAVLADGMGGYSAGEVASGIAVNVISTGMLEELRSGRELSRVDISSGLTHAALLLQQQIALANKGIYEAAQARPECAGKVGAVGFCFGGTTVNTFAVRIPDLAAGVPFYGGQPNAADVPKIKAPLMIHYAGLDERINAGWPAYEAALKANNVKYQMFLYPNTNHGFHNDTTPRYDEAAAKLAWSRTLAFFNENLKA